MADETVLITGVGGGLGLALARAALERGAQVFGLSRRAPTELQGMPGFAFASLDLARFDDITPALSRLLSGVGRLDLAVLNAGVLGQIGDWSETPMDRIRYVMDVNVWANKVLLDALFSSGREVRQVAAISSGAAVSGARGWNAYSVSKAALNMLIKTYAAERPGTHFSSLAPGLVDTDMQAHMRTLPSDPRFPTMDRLRRAHGTADMPSPDEAAPRLWKAFRRLRKEKSGEFFDLRSLPPDD
jgi:benzil reductase ((S)-benzoin forming)